jgi:hypothetical protein
LSGVETRWQLSGLAVRIDGEVNMVMFNKISEKK